jgi:hypothetical protein
MNDNNIGTLKAIITKALFMQLKRKESTDPSSA